MQKFRHFLTRIPTKIVRPCQFTSACALIGEPGAVCRSQIKSFRFRFKSFKYNYVVVFSLIESVPSRLTLTDGRIKSFLVIFWLPHVHLQSSQVISRHLNVRSQSFLVKQCLFAVIHVPFTVVYNQVCNIKSPLIPPLVISMRPLASGALSSTYASDIGSTLVSRNNKNLPCRR